MKLTSKESESRKKLFAELHVKKRTQNNINFLVKKGYCTYNSLLLDGREILKNPNVERVALVLSKKRGIHIEAVPKKGMMIENWNRRKENEYI